MTMKRPFRIRTITAFVKLDPLDFDVTPGSSGDDSSLQLSSKIDQCSDALRQLESSLTSAGYEVQTVRIATNPFGEWLTTTTDDTIEEDSGGISNKENPLQKKAKTKSTRENIIARLQMLNTLLSTKDIDFFSLGPSMNPEHTTQICPLIVSVHPGRFSCSANVHAGDIDAARAAAQCIQRISTLGDDYGGKDSIVEQSNIVGDGSHVVGGLGNFRFCAASCVETVPFFPGARAPSDQTDSTIGFAIGLENGGFARQLLEEAKHIGQIKNIFDTKLRKELMPIQEICSKFVHAAEYPVRYLGIDTSLNPSLDDGGSVADAIECLEEVRGDFGGTGSMAAAAAITTSLQSMPDILTTGYSGLMLPVLEDHRLAELAMVSDSSKDRLTIQKLLCISSVCGVGIDTVPVPGNVSEDSLSSVILDVAALAGRWNKPLSCRVFPVPGGNAGDKTKFDSPFLCNSCIFDL